MHRLLKKLIGRVSRAWAVFVGILAGIAAVVGYSETIIDFLHKYGSGLEPEISTSDDRLSMIEALDRYRGDLQEIEADWKNRQTEVEGLSERVESLGLKISPHVACNIREVRKEPTLRVLAETTKTAIDKLKDELTTNKSINLSKESKDVAEVCSP